MKLKRSVLALLLALAVLLTFGACASSSGSAVSVMKFKDTAISSGMFNYMLASQKDYVEYVYSYYGQTVDWSSTITDDDGNSVTMADYVFNDILEGTKRLIVTTQLCKEFGLEVTDESTVDAIEAEISYYVTTAGDENFLNITLAQYGADVDTARQYMTDSSKQNVLKDYLYGETGTQKIPDSQIKDNFYENYNKMDAILYSFYDYDDSGNATLKNISSITDEARQQYYQENYVNVSYLYFCFYDKDTKLSDDEIAAKKTAAQTLYDQISAGETTLTEHLSESDDPDSAKNPTGQIITSGSKTEEFLTAVKQMNENDLQLIETPTGMYIAQKFALTDSGYTANKEGINTNLTKAVIAEAAEKFYADYTAGTAEFAKDTDAGSTYEEAFLYKAGDLNEELENAAAELKAGETAYLDKLSDGVIIIRKLETNDDDIKDVSSDISTALSDEAFETYISSFYKDIEINQAEIDKYDFLTVKPLDITTLS